MVTEFVALLLGERLLWVMVCVADSVGKEDLVPVEDPTEYPSLNEGDADDVFVMVSAAEVDVDLVVVREHKTEALDGDTELDSAILREADVVFDEVSDFLVALFELDPVKLVDIEFVQVIVELGEFERLTLKAREVVDVRVN